MRVEWYDMNRGRSTVIDSHLRQAEDLLKMGSNPTPEQAQANAAVAMAHLKIVELLTSD